MDINEIVEKYLLDENSKAKSELKKVVASIKTSKTDADLKNSFSLVFDYMGKYDKNTPMDWIKGVARELVPSKSMIGGFDSPSIYGRDRLKKFFSDLAQEQFKKEPGIKNAPRWY